jgi:hypothetical protein
MIERGGTIGLLQTMAMIVGAMALGGILIWASSTFDFGWIGDSLAYLVIALYFIIVGFVWRSNPSVKGEKP